MSASYLLCQIDITQQKITTLFASYKKGKNTRLEVDLITTVLLVLLHNH